MRVLKQIKVLVLIVSLVAGGICGARAQNTQPLVAIHYSELTEAMQTEVASNGYPTASQGGTGYQWWPTNWNYFVMPETLEQAFHSDPGTGRRRRHHRHHARRTDRCLHVLPAVPP